MKKLKSLGESLSRKELKHVIGGGYTGGWAGTKIGFSCFLNKGCTVGRCVGPYFVNHSDPSGPSYIGHCAY